jgi:hypothetical protein
MCRIGGRLRGCVARRRLVVLEIPPLDYLMSNPDKLGGHCVVGSLTGVVASKRVTEAPKGTLSTLGNRA